MPSRVAGPWLPQVASPVESMATITLELQFNISDSLVDCNNSFQFPSYTSVGQETPGQAFILGITSLADADQYGLETAALETQGGSTSDAKFSSGACRTFVTPAVGSMRAALKLMTADKTAGSWSVPYAKLRSATAGKSAYPGTMLISTDVPTSRLAKPVAGDLGKFLTFVAGAGQHSGFGNGQLPPGYLPLTAANGAAKMVAYTKAAAADVTAQNGKVPALNGGQPGGRRPHSPSPSPSPTPSSGSTSGGSQPAPGATSSSGGSPAPTANIQTKTTTPGAANTQPIATTANIGSSVSGAILPLVLLIALIGATIAYGAWQLTRPADPK